MAMSKRRGKLFSLFPFLLLQTPSLPITVETSILKSFHDDVYAKSISPACSMDVDETIDVG